MCPKKRPKLFVKRFLQRNFRLSPALRAFSAKPLVPPAALRCAGGYTLDARFAG
jgi:hypothetical protein